MHHMGTINKGDKGGSVMQKCNMMWVYCAAAELVVLPVSPSGLLFFFREGHKVLAFWNREGITYPN